MKRRNSSPNSTQTNEGCELQKPMALAPQQRGDRLQEFVRDWHTVTFIQIPSSAEINTPLIQPIPELELEAKGADSVNNNLMSEEDFLDLIPINSFFH